MKDDFWNEYINRSKSYLVNSKNVHFMPYIGPKYNSDGLGILVLGESHYIKDPNDDEDDEDEDDDAYNLAKIIVKRMSENSRFSESTMDTVLGCFCFENWKFRFDSAMQITYPYDKDKATYYESDQKLHFCKNLQRTANLICEDKNPFSRYNNHVWDYLAFYNYFQEAFYIASKNGKKDFHKKQINKALCNKSRDALKEVLTSLSPKIVLIWGKFDKKEWKLDEVKNDPNFRNILFIHIKHPAYIAHYRKNQAELDLTDYEKNIDNWKNQTEKYKTYLNTIKEDHPSKEIVIQIYSDLPKNIKDNSNIYLGQKNIIIETYIYKVSPRKNSIFKDSLSNIYLEIIFNNQKEASLYFYTRDHSPQRAMILLKKLKMSGINVNALCEKDGHYCLEKFSKNNSVKDIVERATSYINSILNFRDTFAKNKLNTINDLQNYLQQEFPKCNYSISGGNLTCKLYLKKGKSGVFEDSPSTMQLDIHKQDQSISMDFSVKNGSLDKAIEILRHYDFFGISEATLTQKENRNSILGVVKNNHFNIFSALDAQVFLQTLDDMREVYPDL